MKTTATAALVQFAPLWESPADNLRKLDGMFESISPDTELIFLPEMFTSGFTMNTAMAAHATTTLKWMRDKAKTTGAVIAGSIMVQEHGKYYNRFFWIPPAGEMRYYDKHHLFSMGGEPKVMSAGNSRVIVAHRGIRFILQTCYDLRFPVFVRNRYLNGSYEYDAIVYIASWPAIRRKAYEILLPARAVENQAFVLWINRTGTDIHGQAHSGDSRLVDPRGNVVAQAGEGSEEILHTHIDTALTGNLRKTFQLGRDWKE